MGYVETQAYAMRVHFFAVLHKTKQFGQFLVVLVFYSYSSIDDLDFKEARSLLLFDLYDYLDRPFFGELKGVGLQIKEHLLDSLLIGYQQGTVHVFHLL